MTNNDINHEKLEVIAKMDEKIQKELNSFYEPSDRELKRMIAEAREKYWMDYNSEVRSQREVGREEGRKEAQVAGRKEVIEEVSREMLIQGIDLELISSVTGLSIEELSKLKKM